MERIKVKVSYVPEQNGVAEHKYRSLVEIGRCLLKDAELDKNKTDFQRNFITIFNIM